MPKKYETTVVQPLGDHNPKYPCISTKDVQEYIDLPFEYLNPLQTDFLPYLEDDDTNIVVAAPTSSGKTLVAELFSARAISKGKTVLYIAPMKALADEKEREWKDKKHSFNKYKIEILTGDFKLDEEKKIRLKEADIIILTPEMFNSKCRSYDKNEWLHNTALISDECHLIGQESRGDSEEVAIIQYYENNKNSRALFLSATLPNVSDFVDWLKHLTGRPTELIKSDYRPCKLTKKFVTFYGDRDYAKTEQRRKEKVLELVQRHMKEPTLIFVGSKRFGYELSKDLSSLGIKHHFHNADVKRGTETESIEVIVDGKKEKKEIKNLGREDIESGFRNGDYNVLIASPTLAWGCNTPARYVIISHTHFGLTPMDPADIIQEMGRAGRAGWSDKGDALILCKNTQVQKETTRIFSEYKVQSRLNDVNTLMFHILSYIVNNRIKTPEDLNNWYHQTLASVQKDTINLETAKKVLDNLKSRGMITFKDGIYTANKLGEITARMYMSPLDVSDWFRNFAKIDKIVPESEYDSEEKINLNVAMALARCYNFGVTYAKNDKGEVVSKNNPTVYITNLEMSTHEVQDLSYKLKIEPKSWPTIKYVAVFYTLLNGQRVSPPLNSIYTGITKDIERIVSTLQQCDDQVGKYLKKSRSTVKGFGWGNQWRTIESRIKYGVSHELAEIVSLPNIGKKRAEKLVKIGINTIDKFKAPQNRMLCQKVIGKKIFNKVMKEI